MVRRGLCGITIIHLHPHLRLDPDSRRAGLFLRRTSRRATDIGRATDTTRAIETSEGMVLRAPVVLQALLRHTYLLLAEDSRTSRTRDRLMKRQHRDQGLLLQAGHRHETTLTETIPTGALLRDLIRTTAIDTATITMSKERTSVREIHTEGGHQLRCLRTNTARRSHEDTTMMMMNMTTTRGRQRMRDGKRRAQRRQLTPQTRANQRKRFPQQKRSRRRRRAAAREQTKRPRVAQAKSTNTPSPRRRRQYRKARAETLPRPSRKIQTSSQRAKRGANPQSRPRKRVQRSRPRNQELNDRSRQLAHHSNRCWFLWTIRPPSLDNPSE
mmetsp:Transcript_12222/g.37278  ORF Transcript_12222/g.37278 Transcript_12222/m.37278 type:complete len:327 (+) Transcript_12222:470-1450(+)